MSLRCSRISARTPSTIRSVGIANTATLFRAPLRCLGILSLSSRQARSPSARPCRRCESIERNWPLPLGQCGDSSSRRAARWQRLDCWWFSLWPAGAANDQSRRRRCPIRQHHRRDRPPPRQSSRLYTRTRRRLSTASRPDGTSQPLAARRRRGHARNSRKPRTRCSRDGTTTLCISRAHASSATAPCQRPWSCAHKRRWPRGSPKRQEPMSDARST